MFMNINEVMSQCEYLILPKDTKFASLGKLRLSNRKPSKPGNNLLGWLTGWLFFHSTY